MNLSDDAYVFGMGHFPKAGSTLSFGGDHAEMKITRRAQAALTELIVAGYVAPCEPLDSWPNREHYRGVKSVLPIPKDRPHLNPFGPEADKHTGWTTFTKKEPSTDA
ncbi:MAG: hypothetical protein AAF092_05010 [Pseudomonadota bacterium]